MDKRYRQVREIPGEASSSEVGKAAVEVVDHYPALRDDVIELLQSPKSHQAVYEILGDMMLYGSRITDYLTRIG
jgi:hypothetical protein